MSDCPCDRISIEWACLLLDSHYQQYLLSRDTDVNETIKKLQEIVLSQVCTLVFLILFIDIFLFVILL